MSLKEEMRPFLEDLSRGSIRRALTENRVFRSMFRTGIPTTPRQQALIMFNNVFLHLHPVRIRRESLRITYTFCLGGLSFFLFLLLTVTGVLLMFYYRPAATPGLPGHEGPGHGGQLRAAAAEHAPLLGARHGHHRVLAHAARLLHGRVPAAARVQLGGRRDPAVLTFFLSFTGYLLPWDQLGIWAVTVGTNMAGATPFVGEQASSAWSAATRSATTR